MLEHDAQVFDCEQCPRRLALEKVTPTGLRALDTFETLARRVVMDFQLAPLVFDALRLTMTASEALLLVELLDLIYDIRYPVKTQPHG